jgi:hypothetical protein
MLCGEDDNFILKALLEMSKVIGVPNEGDIGKKRGRERTG